jgi:hypothetical protein
MRDKKSLRVKRYKRRKSRRVSRVARTRRRVRRNQRAGASERSDVKMTIVESNLTDAETTILQSLTPEVLTGYLEGPLNEQTLQTVSDDNMLDVILIVKGLLYHKLAIPLYLLDFMQTKLKELSITGNKELFTQLFNALPTVIVDGDAPVDDDGLSTDPKDHPTLIRICKETMTKNGGGNEIDITEEFTVSTEQGEDAIFVVSSGTRVYVFKTGARLPNLKEEWYNSIRGDILDISPTPLSIGFCQMSDEDMTAEWCCLSFEKLKDGSDYRGSPNYLATREELTKRSEKYGYHKDADTYHNVVVQETGGQLKCYFIDMGDFVFTEPLSDLSTETSL